MSFKILVDIFRTFVRPPPRPPRFKGHGVAFAFALVIVGVGIAGSAPAHAGEGELQALIAKKSAILARMHKKARKALVNAAQDTAFGEYFLAPDHGRRRVAKTNIEHLTLQVQSRFHVVEMCLIAPSGEEISRIAGGRTAPDDELDPDETGTVFFNPGFAIRPKRVYISPLYLSHDADRWVVAYATPVTVGGEKKALLHYEHDLAAYQRRLNKGLGGKDLFLLTVTGDGHVIADSREPVNTLKQGGKEALGDYFAKLDSIVDGNLKRFLYGIDVRREGSTTLFEGGREVAVAFKKTDQGWTLIAIERL